jgi:hypothetical protein
MTCEEYRPSTARDRALLASGRVLVLGDDRPLALRAEHPPRRPRRRVSTTTGSDAAGAGTASQTVWTRTPGSPIPPPVRNPVLTRGVSPQSDQRGPARSRSCRGYLDRPAMTYVLTQERNLVGQVSPMDAPRPRSLSLISCTNYSAILPNREGRTVAALQRNSRRSDVGVP